MKKTVLAAVMAALSLSAMQAYAGGASQQDIEQAFDTLRQATNDSPSKARSSDDGKLQTEYISLDDLKSLVRSEGYKNIEELDNETFIFSRDDIKYLMKRYDDGDLQLYYGLTGIQVTVTDCNDWNRERRLSRAYIDNDGDAVLESDFLATGGINKSMVREFVKVFVTISVPKYKEFLRERDRSPAE